MLRVGTVERLDRRVGPQVLPYAICRSEARPHRRREAATISSNRRLRLGKSTSTTSGAVAEARAGVDDARVERVAGVSPAVQIDPVAADRRYHLVSARLQGGYQRCARELRRACAYGAVLAARLRRYLKLIARIYSAIRAFEPASFCGLISSSAHIDLRLPQTPFRLRGRLSLLKAVLGVPGSDVDRYRPLIRFAFATAALKAKASWSLVRWLR